MRIAGISVSSLIALLVLFLVFSPSCGNLAGKLEKRAVSDDKAASQRAVVRLDRAIAGFYYFAAVFFVIIGLLVSIFPQISEEMGIKYWALVVIGWCLAALSFLLLWYVCRKVIYGDGKFVYINAFGRKRHFSVEDVTGAAVGTIFKMRECGAVSALPHPPTGNVKLHTKKGDITLFRAMAGLDAFLRFLEEQAH